MEKTIWLDAGTIEQGRQRVNAIVNQVLSTTRGGRFRFVPKPWGWYEDTLEGDIVGVSFWAGTNVSLILSQRPQFRECALTLRYDWPPWEPEIDAVLRAVQFVRLAQERIRPVKGKGGRPPKTCLTEEERKCVKAYQASVKKGTKKAIAAQTAGHDVDTLEAWGALLNRENTE